jgi:hypothetical protein
MSLTKTTDYRGYQITTLVQPTYRPCSGFIGRVSIVFDGAEVISDTTAVMSNFSYAENAARNLGHETVDTILGPLEPNAA